MFVAWNIVIVFFHRVVTALNSMELQYQSHYRYDNGALFTKYNYVLLGNTIKAMLLHSMISCNQKCLAEPNCVSFNYQFDTKDESFALCELKNATVDWANVKRSLQYKPGHLYSLIYSMGHMPSSCLDHLRNGVLHSGVYEIHDHNGIRYQAYCDLTSEPRMAWTLVISQAFSQRGLKQFKIALSLNYPLNQDIPRWDAYRLSLPRMNQLKSVSSHWRVTCNFDTDGLLYRDYARARFSTFDALNFDCHGRGLCQRVEYINVRGHNCTNCTSCWWQTKDPSKANFLHHDSSFDKCEFGSTDGAVRSEDNFGWYDRNFKTNPLFRCTAGNSSTTNHWIGGHL